MQNEPKITKKIDPSLIEKCFPIKYMSNITGLSRQYTLIVPEGMTKYCLKAARPEGTIQGILPRKNPVIFDLLFLV